VPTVDSVVATTGEEDGTEETVGEAMAVVVEVVTTIIDVTRFKHTYIFI
jgi:hypothetical protein